jgi:zinc protease
VDLTFQRYSLTNGIALIVKENHHAQSVVIRGRLEGGANLEPVTKAGLASFTTSLMRRGAAKRTFAQINETVEAIGASVSLGCGRHLTTFDGKSLAEDFELLVELLTDCLCQPTFPSEEIERVRGQIITGLKEMEDSPRAVAQRNFRQILYSLDHPYGRSVSGTLETIPTITRADLLDFYSLLQPQGGVVVVVGDVAGEAVYQTLEDSLGQWQPKSQPLQPTVPPPQPLTDIVRQVQTIPNKSQADLVLGNIGPSRMADDFYAAHVGDLILGHLGLGGRIGQIVRDQAGMAYYARTALVAGLGPDPWYIYAGVNPANITKAIDLILAEVRRFRQEAVSEIELADAKAYLTGILPLQMETNEGVANTLLQIHLYQLGDDFMARYPDLINSVTQAEIQAAAHRYLSDEIYALSIGGPYEEKEVQ